MKRSMFVFRLAGLLFLCLFLPGTAGADVRIRAAQSGATADTITIAWQAVQGAAYYHFQAVSSTAYPADSVSVKVSGTEVRLTSVPPDSIYRYIVLACGAGGEELGRSYVYEAAPSPGPITGVSVIGWNRSGTKGSFGLLANPFPNTLSGLEWELWDRKNAKKLCSGVIDGGELEFEARLKNNQLYILKVRGYVNNSGEHFFGPWHSSFVVPEPKIRRIRTVKGRGAVIRWQKVAGADRYLIFFSEKKNSGFRRAAVVKGTRGSCRIREVKKVPLVPGKTYYVRIKAAKGRLRSTGNATRSVRIK